MALIPDLAKQSPRADTRATQRCATFEHRLVQHFDKEMFMATVSSNLGKTLLSAAQLELNALRAGIEWWQVWADQAAALSDLASETVRSFQNGEGSLSNTAKQLSVLGRQSSDKYTDLSKRLTQSYFDELGKLIEVVGGEKSPAGRRSLATRRARGTKSRKRRQ